MCYEYSQATFKIQNVVNSQNLITILKCTRRTKKQIGRSLHEIRLMYFDAQISETQYARGHSITTWTSKGQLVVCRKCTFGHVNKGYVKYDERPKMKRDA